VRRPCGATLYQKVKFFEIFGAVFPHPCGDWCEMLHSQADPHVRRPCYMNRCNMSPLRGEKPDFWPVSKFNTGSLLLRGIMPVKKLLTSPDTCAYTTSFRSLGYCALCPRNQHNRRPYNEVLDHYITLYFLQRMIVRVRFEQ